MKRRLAAMVAAIALGVSLAGPAIAGHGETDVRSYTGCLVSKDGVIIRIKVGEAPSSPCSGNMVQVHFSGGDITSISVTGALTGGGDNGAVVIGLKPEFTLPSGCTAGDVAEWDGSAWACGVDDDTTYTDGTGLDLTGTTFSIQQDYRVKNTPDCSSGQFATGFSDSGAITCTAPAVALADAWFKGSSGAAPEGSDNEILDQLLLAGNYLVFITGRAYDDPGGDAEIDVRCVLYGDAVSLGVFGAAMEVADIGSTGGMTLASTHAVKLTATTRLSIKCRSFTGSDSVSIDLAVLKVGTVNGTP